MMSGLIHALGHLAPKASSSPAHRAAPETGGGFREMLQKTMDGKAGEEASGSVRFSRHAQERLQKRNISLSREDLGHLAQATDVAASRGARDALMMMDDVNMIVSVKNRTVVTVMRADENPVYTNIDTAVSVSDVQDKDA
jgi:flagellar operon protein